MLATRALQGMRSWGFQPINYMPVGHGITECIADNIRWKGMLPEEEQNDSLIVAEAALVNCDMLISSDRHMREIPCDKLNKLLDGHDVGCTLEIIWPTKLQKMFSENE